MVMTSPTTPCQDKSQKKKCANGRRRPRLDVNRRNKYWPISRQRHGVMRQSPVAWSPEEILKPWKVHNRTLVRFFYGYGHGQVLLEREEEEGVWKVMTVPGFRFSLNWLDAIAHWAKNCCSHETTKVGTSVQNKEKNSDQNLSASTSQTTVTMTPMMISAVAARHSGDHDRDHDGDGDDEDGLFSSVSMVETPSSMTSTSSSPLSLSQQELEGKTALVVIESDPFPIKRQRKVYISLRCEKMGLTDMELEMIAKWQQENISCLSLVKLWLFDNKITDMGAPHLAQLIRNDPLLLEFHVSHNSMTNKGAQQILNSISECRKANGKPFWLRMEWNTINHNELKDYISEIEREKGVIVDIPRFHLKRSKGRVSSCLINEQKLAHVRLPWIQCQRLRPSEAPVLMQAKNSWHKNTSPSTTQTTTNSSPSSKPSSSPFPREVSATPSQPRNQVTRRRKFPHSQCHHHNPSTFPSSTKDSKSSSANRQESDRGKQKYDSGGPLLIFPDTSAVLGLIGCKMKSGNKHPYLSFDWLENLCQKGKFGNCIPPNERIFFVLCDSVMKQLDGLKKQNAHVGLCVRKLVNSGLEKYGPAGQDFITILGAHEGEGIIVERNAELLDSRSHYVFNKGQAIDLKIVEVALFFQQELCQAGHSLSSSGNNSNSDKHQESSDQRNGSSMKFPKPNNPSSFPVVLFSNDNVQLMAAKSHGLPAFRYTDLQKFNRSKEIMQPRKPLTASILRKQIGKKAMSGLGACAQKSLQYEFDGIVACMKHLMESYEGARNLLGQTKEILEGNSENKLKELKKLLDVTEQDVATVDNTHHHPPTDEDEDERCRMQNGLDAVALDIDRSKMMVMKSASDEMKLKSSRGNVQYRAKGLQMESESTFSSDHMTSDDFEDFSIFGLCLNNTTATTSTTTTTTSTSTSTSNTINNTRNGLAPSVHTNLSNSIDFEESKGTENSNMIPTATASGARAVMAATTMATNCSNEISEGSSDDETIPLVRAKLLEWEGLVKSYQHPSRILRWTSGHLYPS